MLTLQIDGTEICVSREIAAELAETLWQGRWPGSATSASKITEALGRPNAEASPIEIEDSESYAVRSALEASSATGVAPDDPCGRM